MKLKNFSQQKEYLFRFVFENDEIKEADLKNLIGHHVAVAALASARIDFNWGCLEFKEGMVDIEPKTLYHYVMQR